MTDHNGLRYLFDDLKMRYLRLLVKLTRKGETNSSSTSKSYLFPSLYD